MKYGLRPAGLKNALKKVLNLAKKAHFAYVFIIDILPGGRALWSKTRFLVYIY